MGARPPATNASGAEPALLAGRYRIVEELGRGGMAVVLRVADLRTGRELALKRLCAPQGANRRVLELQFEREYRTLSELRHPSIIAVHDYGLDAGGPFYTMELLRGTSLRRRAPLDIDAACRCLRDVASSLALLHARRLVHRDVGAANVHLDDDGHAKLIDFGALCPFGVADRVIGTPPYVAPETLRGSPIDGRTDLFALGALGYWLVTGRHAYPARRLCDLTLMWSAEVPRPRTLRHEVPQRLEDLLLAMISPDPAGRPSSAADVIDLLTGIAGLPPEPLDAPAAYVAAPALVGRRRQLSLLYRALARLDRGRGRAFRLSGSEGSGKTRLLEQLALHGQLRGRLVLSARAEPASAAFGVVRKLVARALDVTPEALAAASSARIAVVAHALPELAQPSVPLCAIPENAQEWNVVLHSELTAMWLELARACGGLLLLVDDVEHADDASASLLASLAASARAEPLMLVTASRTGASHGLRDGLTALRRASRRVALTPLGVDDIRSLVDSLFSDSPNRDRMARWLHEHGDATPLHCVELVRLLIQRGDIRYARGAWLLPQELPEAEVPRSLLEACRARLLALPPSALGVAMRLSFLPRFSLEQALCISGASHGETLDALDRLVAEDVLRVDGGSYAFGRGGDRDVLSRRLDAELERALRRKLGEWMARDAAANPQALLEAGAHLVAGGAVARGAQLLLDATERLLHDGGALAHAAPALELAYNHYRHVRGGHRQLRQALSHLAVAGYLVDRRYAEDYGEAAMRILLAETGLARASRLRHLVGRKAALPAGVMLALAEHARRSGARQAKQELGQAFVLLVTATIALAGVASLALDRDAVARILDGLQPLAHLPEAEIGSLLYRYCTFLHATVTGREADAQRLGAHILAQFDDERLFPELRGETRVNWRGGLLLAHGIHACYRSDDGALEIANRLQSEGFKLHAMFADQLRMLYHANRGELRLAERFRSRVERYAVRGGTTWQAELVLPASMIMPYYLSDDVVGLRRVAGQLDQLAGRLPSLCVYRDLARALLDALQGAFERASQALETILEAFPIRGRPGWAPLRGALAGVLIDCGQAERARALCVQTLAAISLEERDFPLHYSVPERMLARAAAALGDVEEARGRLHRLIARLSTGDSPLLLGLVHGDGVEVELAARRPSAAEAHLRSARAFFRATACPALIARGERLARMLAEQAQGAADAMPSVDPRELLAGCETARACTLRALELLAADVGARNGRLYVQHPSGATLSAELQTDAEVSFDYDQMTNLASEILATACTLVEDTDTPTETAALELTRRTAARAPDLRPVLLASEGLDGRQIAGTALLWNSGDAQPGAPNPRLIDAVSRALSLRLRELPAS